MRGVSGLAETRCMVEFSRDFALVSARTIDKLLAIRFFVRIFPARFLQLAQRRAEISSLPLAVL
ncbi:MAG: hypothetical protein EBZ13_03685 [Planctomycetia bacterium]|nr:hypothetical protein [Planctomycetia bacterium]